jgi:hypothetical protein
MPAAQPFLPRLQRLFGSVSAKVGYGAHPAIRTGSSSGAKGSLRRLGDAPLTSACDGVGGSATGIRAP